MSSPRCDHLPSVITAVMVRIKGASRVIRSASTHLNGDQAHLPAALLWPPVSQGDAIRACRQEEQQKVMDQARRGGNDVVAVQRRAAERPRPKKSEDGNRQPTQAARSQDDRPQLRTLIFDCGFGRCHRCSVEGGAASANFAHAIRNQRDSGRRERLRTGIRSNAEPRRRGSFSVRSNRASADRSRPNPVRAQVCCSRFRHSLPWPQTGWGCVFLDLGRNRRQAGRTRQRGLNADLLARISLHESLLEPTRG